MADLDPQEPTWLRHDLHIVFAAAVILFLGWLVHERGGAAETKEVGREGVKLRVPASWFAEPAPTGPLVLRGEDAVTRLEIRREEAGSELVSVESSLDLTRSRRYGELYQRDQSGPIIAAGTTWLRTTFSYAFKPSPTHSPRVASAVEYALATGPGTVTIVTLHASEDRIADLEHAVLSTLHKESR